MTEETVEIIVEKSECGENEDIKSVRAAAKRAADLVSQFKEEDSDLSESEVEIIHINTVVNGEDGEETETTPRTKRKRGAALDDSGGATKKKRYFQKYVKDWEKVPAFKPWLSESLVGVTYFYCKFCKSDNKCGKTELEKHMLSRKHIRNSKGATVKVQRKFTFRGLLCPVFTPFSKNGDINYEAIPQYVLYLQRCGVTGILVNDVVGEGMSLTVHERMKLTEEWIKHCQPVNITVMVQIGGASLRDVQEMARHAEMKKASAIVVLPDCYNRPQDHYDLMRYVKSVSSAANMLPLLYHHSPKSTGVDLDMSKFLSDMIGEIDSFVGLIFSSDNLKEAATALHVNPDKYVVFVGTDEFILGSTALGFHSIMSASLNFVPKVVKTIQVAMKDGNVNTAKVTQNCLTNIIDSIIIHGDRLPALKSAMNIATPIKVGPAREPLVNLWEDKIKKIQSALHTIMPNNVPAPK